MSAGHTLAGIVDVPEPARGSSTPTCTAQSHWHQARLIEARGILADIAHHPDTLVLLACRVLCTHGPNSVERADALGVMRLLDKHPPKTVNPVPKGGAF